MSPRLDDPQRQKYLDFEARCRQAFTPFAPIQLPDFFAGRRSVIARVDGELRAPGRQVAIFGERGVGKTSLAALLYFFTPFEPDSVHIVRCTGDDDFESIVGQFLAHFGGDFELDGYEQVKSRGASGRIAGVGGGLTREKRATFKRLARSRHFTSSRLLTIFAQASSLLIVDEFDRVRDPHTHRRLAELIKAFSDARSESKIVVVGVASTLTQLIGEHESLSRSLAQIRLDRMSFEELAEIIKRGAKRTGIEFSPWVSERIIRLADGFPQYIRLLALYSALEAIKALQGEHVVSRVVVTEGEYEKGLEVAIANSEHSLVEAYETATVTTRKNSDIYEVILKSMATFQDPVVQVRDLASSASKFTEENVSPSRLSTPLGNLTKNRGKVLTKVRDGYYRFTNPMLKAYVRLLLEQKYGTQLELPFYQASGK